METEKSLSGEEAEKDFGGRLFFLAAIFPFSNEKACLGVIAKTDFFYRLRGSHADRMGTPQPVEKGHLRVAFFS